MALYYEKDGMCIPRFTRKVSCSEILRYVENWAKLYFVPNIYTPSLKANEHRATNIYAFLKNKARLGEDSYSKACTQMFGIELNNTDKVRVYLNNFTDLIISDDTMSVNQHLFDCPMLEVYPEIAIESAEDYFSYFSVDLPCCVEKSHSIVASLQQIFYGAPGTGKSYTINQDTEGEDVIRTTFHPDTDYSTFVGAYKPTTIEEEVMTVIGTKAVPVENADGSHRKESKIVYEFVQQAFLQAYVAAWKKYAEANGEEPRKQFLVIEEINRGNCAQIFGDLFQLLDRNAQGFSDYPITADADMKRQLKKAFAGLSLAEADSINAMYKGRGVCREVLEGDILLLPGNLYIWATMNTSDQSLFPIDSAFKRRWDWTYRPISDAKEGWKIKADSNLYDWWTFLEKINDKVGSLTNSEDKKLGYFFCKADSENIISADKFVGKVIFYLWNDVFKDYEFGDTIFDDGKGGKLTFDRFYVADTAHETNVMEENIALFLNNLGVEPIPTEITSTDDAVNATSVIKVNGKEIKKINAIPYTVIEEYVKQNQGKTAQEIIDVWEPFKKYSMRSWIVANKAELANMDERYANYSYQIHCADGNSLWVNKDGWMHRPVNPTLRDTINEFIHAVNEANLGVTITEENI